jgi:hypothetical protein
VQVSESSSGGAAVSNGRTSAVQSPGRRVEMKRLIDISVALDSTRPGEDVNNVYYVN